MWDIYYILDVVSKKTGLSPQEIRKTSWGELEEKLGIEKINIGIGRRNYLTLQDTKQILTKKKFHDEEKECIEFLESFYKK